jgi:hypothetical protein
MSPTACSPLPPLLPLCRLAHSHHVGRRGVTWLAIARRAPDPSPSDSDRTRNRIVNVRHGVIRSVAKGIPKESEGAHPLGVSLGLAR